MSSVGDRYPLPEEFKVRAMANLTCHDTPTLKGWWQGNDVELCHELGMFDQERTEKAREERQLTRKAMLKTLAAINELPDSVNPWDESSPQYSHELMQRINYYLARSHSQIVNVQLEDCMMIDTAVNVPGTSSEYPNWQRRLTDNLETFFEAEEVRRFFNNINQCREAEVSKALIVK